MIRHITTAAAATALLLATQSGSALAEDVRVTISYNLTVTAKSEEVDAIAEAQGSARRAMYSMMAKECSVLEETIAQSCKLTKFNIRADGRYRRRNTDVSKINVTGSGTYRIVLK